MANSVKRRSPKQVAAGEEKRLLKKSKASATKAENILRNSRDAEMRKTGKKVKVVKEVSLYRKIENLIITCIVLEPKAYNRFYFVMMSMTVAKVIIATLQLSGSFADKSARAKVITTACDANPDIVVLHATIVAYLADIVILDAAIANCLTKAVGTVAARNVAWKKVHNNLKALMAVAQAAANGAMPLNAVEIIESGLFKVKKFKPETSPITFTVKNSTIRGDVIMKAKGAADKAGMHEWEKSTDGITFGGTITNHLATTIMHGMTPVSSAWFRHRVKTEKRKGTSYTEWEYAYLTIA